MHFITQPIQHDPAKMNLGHELCLVFTLHPVFAILGRQKGIRVLGGKTQNHRKQLGCDQLLGRGRRKRFSRCHGFQCFPKLEVHKMVLRVSYKTDVIKVYWAGDRGGIVSADAAIVLACALPLNNKSKHFLTEFRFLLFTKMRNAESRVMRSSSLSLFSSTSAYGAKQDVESCLCQNGGLPATQNPSFF